MPLEPILFSIDLDGVGSLDVEGEARLVYLDGSDNPQENGWCCDEVRFVAAVLREDGDVSRPICESSARALCQWDGRDLDALLAAEGEEAAARLWGHGRGAFREEEGFSDAA